MAEGILKVEVRERKWYKEGRRKTEAKRTKFSYVLMYDCSCVCGVVQCWVWLVAPPYRRLGFSGLRATTDNCTISALSATNSREADGESWYLEGYST